MDRREAIKRVGMLLGGALSASTVAGVLGGCRAEPSATVYAPQTLSAPQDELVTVLAELIIPETDTPGAKAAGVNVFIDKMLGGWFKDDERAGFLDGLADVEARAQAAYGKAFPALNLDEQTALLTELEDAAIAAMADPQAAAGAGRPFFSVLKELTLVGYYTSEIGATQELRYERSPGRYDGCVPYADLGRAWA